LALTSTLTNVNAHDLSDSVVFAVATMFGCHQFLALTSTLVNVNAHDPHDSVVVNVAMMPSIFGIDININKC
jgi:hypothetical protein